VAATDSTSDAVPKARREPSGDHTGWVRPVTPKVILAAAALPSVIGSASV
jgi:hypothetical protein